MGFLDNLENNLKAMESREERDPAAMDRDAAARMSAREAALRTAPYAEELRNGKFADGLLTACRTIGHRKRVLVRPAWIEETLRLEGGAKRLELRPTPDGVVAVFFEDGQEVGSSGVDLAGDPRKLAEKWMGGEG